jgi:hypothetical protein
MNEMKQESRSLEKGADFKKDNKRSLPLLCLPLLFQCRFSTRK